MRVRRTTIWVLVLVMLLSVSGALAEIETIVNEDGSYTKKYTDDAGAQHVENYDTQDHLTYRWTLNADGSGLAKNYYPDGGGVQWEHTYNSEGNSTQGIWYREDGTRSELQVRNAAGGDDGIIYFEDGVTVQETYSTNSDGRKTEMTIFYEDGTPSRKYQDTPDGGQIASEYYPNGKLSNETKFDADWNRISSVSYSEDGILSHEYEKLPDDAERNKYYSESGALSSINTFYSDGSTEDVAYYENGNIKSVLNWAPDGSYSSKEYDDAGKVISESTGKVTVNYVYRDDALYQTVTQITSDSGDMYTTIRKDAAGNVISENKSTFDAEGNQLTNTVTDSSGQIISQSIRDPETGAWSYFDVDHNGVKTVYHEVDGEYVEEVIALDGTVTIKKDTYSDAGEYLGYETFVDGKLVSTSLVGPRDAENEIPGDRVTTDVNGKVIETSTWGKQADGNLIEVIKNAEGKVIEERLYNEDELYNGGFKVTEGGMEKYSYNDYNEKVVEVYDKAGVLVEVLVINRDGVVISKEVKKVIELPPQPAYTWYPNNTVSTMGLSFREVKPELTKKWYHFTPIDLSREGEQVIPLMASNVYIVGRVYVNVKGDEVTVTYMARGQGSAGTFRVHSEFFTFFPDLASVTEVEPEQLGEGFKFGEPISIEKDLNGDTNVLLFVRNVATYRDYYTGDMRHVRYWPNLKQHKEYREALQGMMD